MRVLSVGVERECIVELLTEGFGGEGAGGVPHPRV